MGLHAGTIILTLRIVMGLIALCTMVIILVRAPQRSGKLLGLIPPLSWLGGETCLLALLVSETLRFSAQPVVMAALTIELAAALAGLVLTGRAEQAYTSARLVHTVQQLQEEQEALSKAKRGPYR